MTAIAIRDLKSNLSSVLARVRQGQRVTVTAHRKPIATIEPLAVAAPNGLPAVVGVVWRGAAHSIGRHPPADLAGAAAGETVSALLLRQRGE